MKKTRIIFAFIIGTILILNTSCSDSDSNPSPTAQVDLAFTSTGSTTLSSGRTNGRTNATIEITDFQISIRDVIFKTDSDDDGIADDSTEVAFRGPYALDLLDETGALDQSIGNAEIPIGVYEELRFKLHKTRDVGENDPLYDRSIFVAGTIDGVPFEMWHDTSENLDVGKSTGVVVDENGVSVSVSFSIDQFLNSEVQIDLSQAVDTNEDGLIQINPDDDDDNKDIADALKDNIKAAADLLDE